MLRKEVKFLGGNRVDRHINQARVRGKLISVE